MIVYLYAISDGGIALDGVVGAAGELLQLLNVDNFHVIASELPDRLPVEPSSLLAQDRVVRTLHERASALLPMRFGSSFATSTDAARAIRLQQAGLAEKLAAVRGGEQMTMRILGALGALGAPDPLGARGASGGPGAGAAYLQERARPKVIAPLLDALAPLTRATLVERGKVAGLIATVYHLIDRGHSATYRASVDGIAAEMQTLSIRVNGPSPCYAFA